MADRADTSDLVHVGRDGWLFLVGGNNDPVSLFRRSGARLMLIWRWSRLLRHRARRCSRLGIRYLHVPVPEKLAVYHDRVDGLRLDPSLGLARPLSRLLPRLCLDLRGPLTEGRADADTFLKLDTHWTSEGCRIGHDTLCAALGAALRWRLDDRPEITFPDHAGDLGSKLRPPLRHPLVQRRVLRDSRRIYANPLTVKAERNGRLTELHQGAHIVLRNPAEDADPRRLMLFGDSFSHFVGTGLTAMLAETFREVHFIWHPSIDWSYVERVRPDIVVTEMAERFMLTLPPSDEGFDSETFSTSKLPDFEKSA